ncbi:MAG: hypothetical protein HC845_14930 [Akkermansiaceae bacterium]|nr:hypothetical protein [Akkermansiaceae bacterium]
MRQLLVSSFSLLIAGKLLAAPDLREAPNLTASPANQLVVSGNACGPTALLNAFRYGNKDWQRASKAISGETDKQQIYTIIREVAMRPSANFKGRPRWSRKGVNLTDLCDIGNELTRGQFLPLIEQEIFFRQTGETSQKLLNRTHQRFGKSLSKGLPPIISLRRYALRNGNWVILDAHFVTLFSLPKKLEKGATSFPVTYIDPWGGKIQQGEITIANQPILSNTIEGSPCLEAQFPQASVGKKLVKSGEKNALTISAALGRW